MNITDTEALAEELSKGEIPSRFEWLQILEEAEKLKGKRLKEEAAERRRIKLEEEKKKHERLMSEITSMDLPLEWSNTYAGTEAAAGIAVQSAADGLIVSIHNLGRVDIEYISMICGQSCKEVISALKGSLFQNPDTWQECFYKGWETADNYLSGNLMRKYRAADKANTKYSGYFSDNLSAIKAVLPPACSYKDIYITLGSPWVPVKIIDEFIKYLFGDSYARRKKGRYKKRGHDSLKVEYETITGTWHIPDKDRYGNAIKVTRVYGTLRMNALHILEKTLNMQTIKIYDEIPSPACKSGKKRILNQDETINACEKQQKIAGAFCVWVWQDEARKEQLEEIFYETYGACLKRNFEGGFLTFPGKSDKVEMRPYQKDAVAKILFTPNVLLAHEVGAGKTYVMAAAGMELRRMGISKKNMYVVPNNILRQWRTMFLELYPDAKLLVIAPKDFTPDKRQAALERIRNDDCDAIILSYSSFELIPLSKEHYKDAFNVQLERIENVLSQSNDIEGRLWKRKKKLEEAMEQIAAVLYASLPGIYFDDLGINTLFVDEAHNFKNLSIDSKIDHILGINKTGSNKCNEMLEKVRCVQKNNDGRGVVFATGTPITNSITDVFVMQTYLQYGELRLLNIDLFDNWAGMFAEKTSEFEINVTTSGYRIAARFARFHNLPELTSVFAQIADFLRCPHSDDLPVFSGYTNRLIGKTKELENYITGLSTRADAVKSGLVPRQADNMLKITTDGRKAALDIRLVDNTLPFNRQSKAAVCAEWAAYIYNRTVKNRSTQIIFCDFSIPKDDFNMYDEMKRLLTVANVPPHEIAFIHDYDAEKDKEELFKKMQAGEIRILLGSTFKLGIGVNVQKKLIAIHHLDIPWRPSDMAQREGRIIRQGNENKKVAILRYISEGSFDAYSWQLLETKQKFIVDLLGGFSAARSSGDIDSTVLNYAEVKALAIGNPLIKKRIEITNELMRVNALNKNMAESRINLELERRALPGRLSGIRQTIKNAESDFVRYRQKMILPKEMKNRDALRKLLHNGLSGNILSPRENLLLDYQGFKVILPPNMIFEKPFVWLEGQGRYMVELGDTETGNLIRIDRRLNTLGEFIAEQKDELEKLTARQKEVEGELSKKESFADEIAGLRTQLEKVDKELGVNKQ